MCVTACSARRDKVADSITFFGDIVSYTHAMFDVVEVVVQFSVLLNYCENRTIIIINYEKYINV